MRMRNRLTHTFATKLLMQAVDQLFLAMGGSALGLQHPVQRFWRDIHAVELAYQPELGCGQRDVRPARVRTGAEGQY